MFKKHYMEADIEDSYSDTLHGILSDLWDEDSTLYLPNSIKLEFSSGSKEFFNQKLERTDPPTVSYMLLGEVVDYMKNHDLNLENVHIMEKWSNGRCMGVDYYPRNRIELKGKGGASYKISKKRKLSGGHKIVVDMKD